MNMFVFTPVKQIALFIQVFFRTPDVFVFVTVRYYRQPYPKGDALYYKCIVPQNRNLLPFLYFPFVRVIRLLTNWYAFFCIY